MRTVISTCAIGLLGGLVSVFATGTEQADFSRYQIIIEKNLFGEPVIDPVPVAGGLPVLPPPPPIAQTLRVCGIHEEGDSAWVALVDLGTNPNQSSYTKVGDDNGYGVKVLEVDLVGARVFVSKGDKKEWLSMEQTAAATPSAGRPLGLPVPTFMRTPPPMTPPAMAVNPSMAAPSPISVAERLRLRREAMARMYATPTSQPPSAVSAPTNALPELSLQERIKKLREYNIELIKAKGAKGPALPIQLTAEEDAQLVKDGVLAPQPAVPNSQPQE
jgi:hypothetical protein